MKKKVLLFCANPVNGGTAKVFTELVIGMKKDNMHNFDIISAINEANNVSTYNTIPDLIRLNICSEEEIFKNEKDRKSYIYKLYRRIKRFILYYRIQKKNIRRVRDFIKENQIEEVMVHSGGYHGDGLCEQVLMAAKAEGILKRIMVFHNDFKKNKLQRFIYFFYDQKISCLATQIITVSNFTKVRIEKNSYIRKKIDVIYNGLPVVENENINEMKKTLKIESEKRLIIGMIGNFEERKGHILLLQSLAQLIKHDKQFHLVMIGNILDSQYYKQCLEVIKSNGMGSYITIIEGIYNAGQYAQCFDFMVFPSIEDESFGLVAVEAMSYGVPVITFQCGGIPEVVGDQKEGFVIPLKDVDKMAKAISSMLNNPVLRKTMGNNAKEKYVKQFSVSTMVKNYRLYF